MTVTTFPPVVMGVVARIIRCFRKTPYLYHCMDLYPEIALTTGILKRGWPARIAMAIDRRNCEQAQAVVVLSHDMLQTLEARNIETSHVHIINNFIIDEVKKTEQFSLPFQDAPNTFRVLFAGNIGRFQSLDTVVKAAQLLEQRLPQHRIEFWLIGSGVMVERLQQQIAADNISNVHFHPYLPIEKVMLAIAHSHLGIVSLLPGVIRSAYPSKTMSYLEGGCPLLLLLEPESELARMVIEEKLGYVCETRTPESVAKAVENAYFAWQSGDFDRCQIRLLGRKLFGKQEILSRWSHLLLQLAPQTENLRKA